MQTDAGSSPEDNTQPTPGSVTPGAQPTQNQRGRRRRRILGIAAAAVVAIVGVAEFLVPAIINAGRQSTSADTIEVRTTSSGPASAASPAPSATQGRVTEKSDPLADAAVLGGVTLGPEMTDPLEYVTTWLLPVSAPFSTFPEAPDGSAECSSEQLRWLEKHATRDNFFDDSVTIAVRNRADVGGALSLENVRFEGDEVATEAWIRFHCPDASGGATSQTLMVDMDGSPAVWGSEGDVGPEWGEGAAWGDTRGEDFMPVGALATINLGPGQLAQIQLNRTGSADRQRSYAGRILADLADGSETVVLAEGVEFLRDPLPGYRVEVPWDDSDGALSCLVPEDSRIDEYGMERGQGTPCTVADAAALLVEAGSSAASVE